MANLNNLTSASANNNGVTPSVVNPPAASVETVKDGFEWGSNPTTQYILLETTVSGKSFKMPTPGMKDANKKLANVWPGAIYWTESKKAGAYRLFTKLNAMVLQRDSKGIPLLDSEGELTWKDGVQVTLCKQGLNKVERNKIAELNKAKDNNPKLAEPIETAIADIQKNAGWIQQKLDNKSFVTGICDSGESILPVTMYLNLALSSKESLAFVKSVQKLGDKPALLRFYIPVERLTMPKEQFKPVKVKVGNSLLDMKHPGTNEPVMGPEFSWGNRTQPIAKIELIPNKYLPSSEGMDRVLSVEESKKRIALMERPWETNDEGIKLWAESLKGKFSSSGNRWAHKAGALPKRSASSYAGSCAMWEDAVESPAKLEKWSEALRNLVGVKPRLNEENQKGNDNTQFSKEACEAIIASASQQSIEPWMDYVTSIGGTVKPVETQASTPVETPVEAPVEAPGSNTGVEPEVQAIEEEEISSEPTEQEILAAILAAREEESLDDLEDEEDLTGDFFGGNIQE